jgi:hypothetical protein
MFYGIQGTTYGNTQKLYPESAMHYGGVRFAEKLPSCPTIRLDAGLLGKAGLGRLKTAVSLQPSVKVNAKALLG